MIDTIVWSEYMNEQEEQAVMDMFGIPRELARDAIVKAGKDIKRIKRYLNKTEKSVGHCKMCGKKLTDPESVRRGFGSECYKKVLQEKIGFIDLED
jgi:hypothetical protein